jgi:hypothetical protein
VTIRSRLLFITAAAGAALAAVIVTTSYLPGAPYLPDVLGWILIGLLMPVWAIALIRLLLAGGRALFGSAQWRAAWWHSVRARVPIPLVAAAIVLFLAGWLVGATSIIGMSDGSPVLADGAWYLDNRGTRTPVTEEVYRAAVAREQRTFVAGPMGMYAIACVFILIGTRPSRIEERATA